MRDAGSDRDSMVGWERFHRPRATDGVRVRAPARGAALRLPTPFPWNAWSASDWWGLVESVRFPPSARAWLRVRCRPGSVAPLVRGPRLLCAFPHAVDSWVSGALAYLSAYGRLPSSAVHPGFAPWPGDRSRPAWPTGSVSTPWRCESSWPCGLLLRSFLPSWISSVRLPAAVDVVPLSDVSSIAYRNPSDCTLRRRLARIYGRGGSAS